MSEVLIKARDATHADPEKDRRGCYKRGDPVVVMPDGHPWGRYERLRCPDGVPRFWRVRIDGAPRTVVEPFIHPHYRGLWTPAHDAQVEIRRRWRFMPELLMPRDRLALFADEIVTIDWQTWLRCLHDKTQTQGRGVILMAA